MCSHVKMVGSHEGIHCIKILRHLDEVRCKEGEARNIDEVFANAEADGNGTDTRGAPTKLIDDDEALRSHPIDNVAHLCMLFVSQR